MAEQTTQTTQTEPLLQFFVYEHLPQGILREASKPFCLLAEQVAATYPRNAERTVCLRKLLEAKDAAVRTHILKGDAPRATRQDIAVAPQDPAAGFVPALGD